MKHKKDILKGLWNLGKKEIKNLEYDFGGIKLYKAGIGKREEKDFYLFSRDLILSSLMLNNNRLLKNVLKFCIKLQGKKKDAITGEEPGKIAHEFPEVIKNRFSTKYNAADTTSLFLIGLWEYYLKTKDKEFIKKSRNSIETGISYILTHLDKNRIFWESPSFCGAKKFALNSTYWKDHSPARPNITNTVYPIAYSLLQSQVIKSLRCALKLSQICKIKYKPKELGKISKKCLNALNKYFWDEETGSFIIAIDKQGKISLMSSDSLHMLYYLEKKDISKERIKKIFKKAEILETEYGYRTAPSNSNKNSHTQFGMIWPWEQYFIGVGALKFGDKNVFEKSFNVIKVLEKNKTFPEFFSFNKKIELKGKKTQLWTIAYVKGMLDLIESNNRK